jgi:hypothetical protein
MAEAVDVIVAPTEPDVTVDRPRALVVALAKSSLTVPASVGKKSVRG